MSHNAQAVSTETSSVASSLYKRFLSLSLGKLGNSPTIKIKPSTIGVTIISPIIPEIVSTTAPTDPKFHPAKKQIIPIMILMNASINPGIRRCNEKTIKKARTANPTETTSRGQRKSIGICPQLLFLPANIAQVKTQTTAAMIIYSHCIRIASIFAIISQP